MAETKKYLHNLDVSNNKVINLLLNPLTTAQRLFVGGTLGIVDEGYSVYDTTTNELYFWDGMTWVLSSGTTTWGSITGTVTAQTDLTTYLSTNYYPLSSNPAGYLTSSSISGMITGSGTLNYIPKWTPSGTVLGNSQIFDDGSSVGIGTVTPNGKLTIQTGNSAYPLEIRTSNYGGANRGGFEFDVSGNLELSLQNLVGAEIVRLRSNGVTFFNGGNVGINTPTPSYKLDVNGTFHTTGQNTLDDLAGSGTRMVVASSTGVLSTQTIPSGGSGSRSINSISSNTPAGSTSGTDYVYLVSGTTTITLPTAVGNTNLYTIKRVGTGVVSIATTSSQTIDGSSSPIIINVQYVSIDLISDGTNWNII
jgi:hypothetical protein